MMHSRFYKRIWLVVVLGFLLVLTACNFRQGWVEVTLSDRIRATYSLFDGQNGTNVELASGEVLTLEYDIEITKGDLTLQIINPDKVVIWEESFNENAAGNTSITAEIEGVFQLVEIGEMTGGGFDLHWEILADK